LRRPPYLPADRHPPPGVSTRVHASAVARRLSCSRDSTLRPPSASLQTALPQVSFASSLPASLQVQGCKQEQSARLQAALRACLQAPRRACLTLALRCVSASVGRGDYTQGAGHRVSRPWCRRGRAEPASRTACACAACRASREPSPTLSPTDSVPRGLPTLWARAGPGAQGQ